MSIDPGLQIVGHTIQQHYVIQELVGEGGMAYVYKARHKILQGPVAIKILQHRYTQRDDFRERFLREARLQYQILHPHIVRVLDFIDDDGLVGCVQEWCDGGELTSATLQRRPGETLPLSQLKQHFFPLLDALGEVHKQGYVHRDIKPHNILLQTQPNSSEVHWKISDFGLLKDAQAEQLTQSGAIIGTFHYISPEQFEESKKVDQRADIYSMGVVLYQLLLQQVPFPARMPRLAIQIMETPAPIPSTLPAPLGDVLRKVLSKRPDDRYESCAAFKRALSLAIDEISTQQPEPQATQDTNETQQHTETLPRVVDIEPEESPPPKPRERSAPGHVTPQLREPTQELPKKPIQAWFILTIALFGIGGGSYLLLQPTTPTKPIQRQSAPLSPDKHARKQHFQHRMTEIRNRAAQYANKGNWGKTRYFLQYQCKHNKRLCYSYARWIHKTLDVLKRSCDLGDKIACHWSKISRQKGRTEARYRNKAIPIYKRACRQGEWQACISLGTKHMTPQIQERKRWLQRACQKKIGRGCLALGHLLLKTPKMRIIARQMYRKACLYHEPDGCAAWGKMHIKQPHQRGAREAILACRQACQQHHASSCQVVAQLKQTAAQ